MSVVTCAEIDYFLSIIDDHGEIKRELKRILLYECRCNERLKAKFEGSTRLEYTGFRGDWNTFREKRVYY